MKKFMIFAAAAIMTGSMLLAGCGSSNEAAEEETTETTETEGTAEENTEPADGEVHHIKIHVKDYGTIEAELDAAAAPVTVENFMKLANEGFYDGLTFHRIISGFMIQGGDPNGNGTGGAEETIKGEFAANGIDNPIKHVRGTLSMARSQDPDSASSQFFIMHEDAEHLDGQYAGFGHVTAGMEIVDQICEDAKPIDGNGTIPPEAQPVIESIEVVD